MKPRFFTVALATGSLGLCAYLLRLVIRRRQRAIDVGTVSAEWLSHRRGLSDESAS